MGEALDYGSEIHDEGLPSGLPVILGIVGRKTGDAGLKRSKVVVVGVATHGGFRNVVLPLWPSLVEGITEGHASETTIDFLQSLKNILLLHPLSQIPSSSNPYPKVLIQILHCRYMSINAIKHILYSG